MKMEWQPIETAPTDGSAVLLWDGGYRTGRWVVGFGRVIAGGREFRGGRWVDLHQTSGGEFDEPVTLGPSRWSPLPRPPA